MSIVVHTALAVGERGDGGKRSDRVAMFCERIEGVLTREKRMRKKRIKRKKDKEESHVEERKK